MYYINLPYLQIIELNNEEVYKVNVRGKKQTFQRML